MLSEITDNYVPFKVDDGKGKSNKLSTDNIFRDRSKILSLLENDLDMFMNPTSSCVKPLNQYLSLNYSDKDILTLMDWVIHICIFGNIYLYQ
jgi:hypothetical protein